MTPQTYIVAIMDRQYPLAPLTEVLIRAGSQASACALADKIYYWGRAMYADLTSLDDGPAFDKGMHARALSEVGRHRDLALIYPDPADRQAHLREARGQVCYARIIRMGIAA